MSAQDGKQAVERPAPSDEDFAVARETLAKDPKRPKEGSAEWESMVGKLAMFRAEVGGDRFDLHFRRREPRDGVERLTLQADREGWSLEKLREEVEAVVHRPVDAEMLQQFCDAVAERVQQYAAFLTMVIDAATDQRDPQRGDREHDQIEASVAPLREGLPLYTPEIETALKFLQEVRSERGEAVRWGDATAPSAHDLAIKEVDRAPALWWEFSKTSERSRTDPRYSRAVSAAELYYEVVIEAGKTPKPSDLKAMNSVERTVAERILKARDHAQTAASSIAPAEQGLTYRPINFFPGMDRRIREAAAPGRKRKKVRRHQTDDGDYLYCVEDVRRNWPREFEAISDG